MITVEQFERGEIKLTDEWFDPIFRIAYFNSMPFKKLVCFKGKETGTLLHPDFDDILEQHSKNPPQPPESLEGKETK